MRAPSSGETTPSYSPVRINVGMRLRSGRCWTAGARGTPLLGAYGASKAALIAMTRNMAREWAPYKVRVNVISPGPIRSEMTEGAERSAPGFYERAGNATMLKRVADTREVIGPVLYLASDASSYITGEDHCVSGGMLRG